MNKYIIMKNLTPEEIKTEMLKIKIPWLVKFADRFWFKAGWYIMFFGLVAMFPIGIIINESNDPNIKFIFFQIALYLFFFLLIGLGGLMLINNFVKNNFVKKQAKRLGLTLDEWNYYVKKYKIISH